MATPHPLWLTGSVLAFLINVALMLGVLFAFSGAVLLLAYGVRFLEATFSPSMRWRR